MTHRAYGAIRSLIDRMGGTVYERQGHRYGAWVIRIHDQTFTVEASGNRLFPELDALHVPRVSHPQHWDDYKDVLVPDAEARLLSNLRTSSGNSEGLSRWTAGLVPLVERTKWKFAWTYARTYPHEYTTKALCSPDDHARLIDCIERYGVLERFGKDSRKYLYFEERRYWHMSDPNSKDPEQWPNVINRAWIDVRRHAANVEHRWTPEEVQLQMRLWEIQLEKSTDRRGSNAKAS